VQRLSAKYTVQTIKHSTGKSRAEYIPRELKVELNTRTGGYAERSHLKECLYALKAKLKASKHQALRRVAFANWGMNHKAPTIKTPPKQ
jgi:hypothetical protein